MERSPLSRHAILLAALAAYVSYTSRSKKKEHGPFNIWPEVYMVTNMADVVSTVLGFILALIVSTIVIWVVTKLFGEKEGIGTALIAAIAGTIIYTIAYWLLGNGLLAAILGGIVWLLALKGLYKIGWLKALVIAIAIWILTWLVGLILPTLTGPL